MSDHIKGDDEVRFIKENRITQSPLKKQLKTVAKIAVYGLVFGAVAGASYKGMSSFAGKFFQTKTTQETVSIEIETDAIPSSAEVTTAVATEPVEEIVDNAIKNYDYSVDTVKSLMSLLSTLADDSEDSFVRVLALKNGMDWFNNEMQTSGLLSGVIIADTETEVIVLAPTGELDTADSIQIAFSNQTQTVGTLKESDAFCGLSVLSVLKEDMDEKTREDIEPIALGNVYNLKRGDIVIGMGSPLGAAGSVTYGNISYVSNNTSIVDGQIRLIYSDASSDVAKGSFFVNTDGELIGWASDKFSESTSATMIAGLSDFKPILEKMTNAMSSAFIGIKGADITQNMRESGIPEGVYVVDVSKDSPAYVSGIQPGDIIVRIGEEKISSVSGFKKAVDLMSPEELKHFTLVRDAKNEYKELQMEVTVGSR